MVQHTKFYDVMGVEPTVTPEELKKAYRRRALQLHPDKRGNSPEAQEEFTTMKHAYDVLSDPRQREIYDATGEDGLKMVNGFGEMSMEEMMASAIGALSSLGGGAKFCILMSITAACAVILLVPVLWCLRVDKTVDWSWVDVFIPMWVLDAIYICASCCSLVSKDAPVDENGDPIAQPPSTFSRLLTKSLRLLKALLFVASQILIAMKLQATLDVSGIAVLAPYLVLEGILLTEKVIVGYQVYTSLAAQHGTTNNDSPNSFALYGSIMYSIVQNILRFVLVVLVGLKVDGTIDGSWWLVFLPVWIYMALSLCSTVRSVVVASRLTADSTPNGKTSGVVCMVVTSCIMFSPFVVLAARLEGSFSSFYVLLPWLIVAGIAVGSLWLCLCCLLRSPHDAAPAPSTTEAPSEGRPDGDVYHVVHDDDKV
ncbi:hypothetical protein H310_03201 [Aphanomyces invadans]|uniref:J domain-containing protein n=1 Tax=Aphanomyces invadans TaxID=157072 RepID=A0A024UGC0_9STRA|nr:hypothetical protein H310_03201 [Aphanomyces invadans]ETW05436.1 hypothetical protein H310_03201 [Aphanomyces invadans]|eukprot:XP_008865213.1 hypothetical protein H310_03201 [Aphanomyces invadans]